MADFTEHDLFAGTHAPDQLTAGSEKLPLTDNLQSSRLNVHFNSGSIVDQVQHADGDAPSSDQWEFNWAAVTSGLRAAVAQSDSTEALRLVRDNKPPFLSVIGEDPLDFNATVAHADNDRYHSSDTVEAASHKPVEKSSVNLHLSAYNDAADKNVDAQQSHAESKFDASMPVPMAPGNAGKNLNNVVAQIVQAMGGGLGGGSSLEHSTHKPKSDDSIGFVPEADLKRLIDQAKGFTKSDTGDAPAKNIDEIRQLAGQLGDDNPEKRAEAEQQLKAIGAQAIPELVRQLGDDDFQKRDGAENLLRSLGIQALPDLLKAKDNQYPGPVGQFDPRVQGKYVDSTGEHWCAHENVEMGVRARRLINAVVSGQQDIMPVSQVEKQSVTSKWDGAEFCPVFDPASFLSSIEKSDQTLSKFDGDANKDKREKRMGEIATLLQQDEGNKLQLQFEKLKKEFGHELSHEEKEQVKTAMADYKQAEAKQGGDLEANEAQQLKSHMANLAVVKERIEAQSEAALAKEKDRSLTDAERRGCALPKEKLDELSRLLHQYQLAQEGKPPLSPAELDTLRSHVSEQAVRREQFDKALAHELEQLEKTTGRKATPEEEFKLRQRLGAKDPHSEFTPEEKKRAGELVDLLRMSPEEEKSVQRRIDMMELTDNEATALVNDRDMLILTNYQESQLEYNLKALSNVPHARAQRFLDYANALALADHSLMQISSSHEVDLQYTKEVRDGLLEAEKRDATILEQPLFYQSVLDAKLYKDAGFIDAIKAQYINHGGTEQRFAQLMNFADVDHDDSDSNRDD